MTYGRDEVLYDQEVDQETQYDVDIQIPIEGFLTIQAKGISNFKRGFDFLNEKLKKSLDIYEKGFSLFIECDVFHQNRNLASETKKTQSQKLRNSFDDTINLSCEFFIKTSDDIINYFKQKSFRLSLVLQPDIDPDKKIYLGYCDVPFLSILLEKDGVLGDYAMKNDHEQFIGLFDVKATYTKESLQLQPKEQEIVRGIEGDAGQGYEYYEKEKSLLKFIININEIMNFLRLREFDSTDKENILLSFSTVVKG
jgi:hypothetical protein